jgi:nucleoside-diphosphate-sugar epimerase
LNKDYPVIGTYRTEHTKQKLKDASIKCLHVDLAQPIPDALFETDVLCIFVSPSSNKDRPYPELFTSLLAHPKFKTLKQVIFTSSTSVYEKSDAHKDETHPLKTNNPILEVERALSVNENLCVLRMAGLMGEGRYLTKYYPAQRVLANALSLANHIHQVDAVGSIQAVIEHELKGVYNICAPMHPTKQAIIEAQCEVLHVSPPSFEQVSGESGTIDATRFQKATHYTFYYPDPRAFPL